MSSRDDQWASLSFGCRFLLGGILIGLFKLISDEWSIGGVEVKGQVPAPAGTAKAVTRQIRKYNNSKESPPRKLTIKWEIIRETDETKQKRGKTCLKN